MQNITFLDKLTQQLFDDFDSDFSEAIVVLPNKRAKVFLLERMKKYTDTTFFAPQIISIDELIKEMASVNVLDPVALLFEFYEVYKSITPKENQQAFEVFSNWAKMLIQDFNEIDRYLLNPIHVFSYLKDIEDIKHWSLDLESRTSMIQNYLNFWETLPLYYNQLYAHLLSKKAGYQGLVYREAVNNLEYFSKNRSHLKYYFSGFNALNQAEEKIIQHLLKNNQARVFWDQDIQFLNDPYHDAGYFARKIKENWGYYKTHPYEWIVDEFRHQKDIHVISTPKAVGQAKIAGKIIEDLQKQNSDLTKVAVILSDEKLLMPVLYALPKSIKGFNITMGYESASNPIQIFLSKVFKMHINALKRNQKTYVYYHKEVVEVLSHPLLFLLLNGDNVVKKINRNNLTFFSNDTLLELQDKTTPFYELVIGKWDIPVNEIVERIQEIILHIKKYLQQIDDRLSLTFLFSMYKAVNQIKNYIDTYEAVATPEQLYIMYKQIADLAEVSFEGEPLEGLQIMGVLESRVLDFDTVIITSLNEGKFPSGKSNNSFIPYDVKQELGLPTYKEKDAIYSYHFYHMIKRAGNVYLIYNSETEGMNSAEKSRFITQLEIEKQPNHNLINSDYYSFIPDKAYEPLTIPKSSGLLSELKKIATEKGFSPSALSNYLRNPIQFYFQRILRIRELDEVEENVALNTLGTIIHNSLEELFRPYLNQYLTLENMQQMEQKVEAEINSQFELIYSNAKDKLGKNLLAYEVAKRNIIHYLNFEKEAIINGDAIKILALEIELSYEITDERLPYPVKISGIVDRIEIRNNTLRIIDYKTGRVEKNQVRIKTFDGLTADLKYEKVIQLLGYALMYQNEKQLYPLEVGIYSFKNRKEGFLLFNLEQDKHIQTVISSDIIDAFKNELIGLILEILDPKIAFEENMG